MKFPVRGLALLFLAVVATALISAVVWEYWLEEPVFRLFGWAYQEPVETLDRWNLIETSTIFAALSLVIPIAVLWRTLRVLASHRGKLEDSVAERTAALRASQAMLSTAEHIARVGSWDWDIAGGSLIWSDEQCRLFGYAPGTFPDVYEGWMTCVHPDDQKRVQDAIDAAVAGERPYDVEYPVVARDGSRRIIHAKGEVFRAADGTPLRMVGTCHDVTDRTKAAAELKLAHDLLESEIETSPDAILVVDTDGCMVSFNQRFLDMWAIPKEVARSRDDAAALAAVLDLVKDPDGFMSDVKRLYEHPGETSHDEIELNDGRILERYTAGMYGTGQNYLGRIWFFRDITKRKRAGRVLEESEARLRGILDNIADMVVTIDDKGRIESFNQAAEQFFGYKEFEVVGRNVSMLAVSDDQSNHDNYLRRYIETGDKKIIGLPAREVNAVRKDGSEALVEISVSEMRLGKRRLFVGAMRDITERKRAAAALRESEERLRVIFEKAPVGIGVAGKDGRFTSVNAKFADMLGYTPAEMLALRNTDITHADDIEVSRQNLMRLFQRESDSYALEKRYRRKDGSALWGHLTVSAVADEAGHVEHTIGVIEDITEQKKAQEALRESEERLTEAVRVSDIGIFDHDQRADVIYWSPQQREIHGWGADEPITLPDFLELVHPEDRDRVVEAVKRAHDPQQAIPFDIEYRIVRRDGDVRWLTTRAHTFFEGEGAARRPVRTVGAVLDITERKKAAAETEFANNLLMTQIENSPDGILVVDADRKVLLYNRRFGDLWKIPPDVVAARVDDAILKTGAAQVKDPEQFYARVMHLYEHPEQTEKEDIEFKDGRVFERHSMPLRDSNGKYIGRLWVFRDITERRHSEEALRQAQKLESVGQLTGGVAHNFNNLLSVVIGNLELLLDHAGKDASLKHFAQAALDGALRGAELTSHLLAFSRKQALQPRLISLAEQLPQMGGLLQSVLGEQIAVSVRSDPELWSIAADPAQIDSAILNLALNARDAMPNGGRLVIDATNVRIEGDASYSNEAISGDYVLLAVSDTGTGIPPEVLERVFEPFFTTKEVGKGSGLGLSMVYGFVKQSSGNIKIQSEPGHGTTIKIYLPRATAAGATEAPPPPPRDDKKAPIARGKEKILVVEDNENVRTAVVEQLTGLGYSTLAAETGKEALALLRKHADLDLVFSDVVMRGGMSGYELAEEIRTQYPELKVLLTTGYDMETASGSGEGVASFEVLSKPYRLRELAARLRQILESERQRRPAVQDAE